MALLTRDLPDFIAVTSQQLLVDLVENDYIHDLSDLYNQYASEGIREMMRGAEDSFNMAVVDGGLMAIPQVGGPLANLPMMWIREDWLNNLGLDVPTTMAELLDVADAFTNRDPDGNGLDDTIAFTFTKIGMGSDILSFFYSFHAYPQAWIRVGDRLEYGGIQPEVREALLALQRLYSLGQMDREFNTKDFAQTIQMFGQGRSGIVFGGVNLPFAGLSTTIMNDPDNAIWLPVPLVSNDSRPATPIANATATTYYVMNKQFAHPEAVLKMTDYSVYVTSIPELNSMHANFYFPLLIQNPTEGLRDWEGMTHAVDSGGDLSKLRPTMQPNYYRIMDYINDNELSWWTIWKQYYGDDSGYGTINKYYQSCNYLPNAFFGMPTENMTNRKSMLDALEDEMITKVIMGDDISAFDQFVNNWKSMGGDLITDEVNEWQNTRRHFNP